MPLCLTKNAACLQTVDAAQTAVDDRVNFLLRLCHHHCNHLTVATTAPPAATAMAAVGKSQISGQEFPGRICVCLAVDFFHYCSSFQLPGKQIREEEG